MISGSQVQLGEDRCSVELMDDVVHGGCDVAFALYGGVGFSHVGADPHFIWVFWFGRRHNWGEPWNGACDFLYDFVIFEFHQFVFDFFSKWHPSVWLTGRLHVFVDV